MAREGPLLLALPTTMVCQRASRGGIAVRLLLGICGACALCYSTMPMGSWLRQAKERVPPSATFVYPPLLFRKTAEQSWEQRAAYYRRIHG